MHQGAQTFIIHTRPFMSAGLKVAVASPTSGSVKPGAVRPMNGDGTSRGLRKRPLAKNPTRTRKRTSGSQRFMIQTPCAATCFGISLRFRAIR